MESSRIVAQGKTKTEKQNWARVLLPQRAKSTGAALMERGGSKLVHTGKNKQNDLKESVHKVERAHPQKRFAVAPTNS